MLELSPLLRDLRLDDLATLVCLVEHRSFSIVARRQGVTHSTVRKALGRIEESFGKPLFSRTTRELVPTGLAEQCCSILREGLTQLASLESLLSERASASSLRFAVSSVHSVVALAIQDALPAEVQTVADVGPDGFAQPPTHAPFELALVNEDTRVAPGWVRVLVGTQRWLWMAPDNTPAIRLRSADAPPAPSVDQELREVPSFQQAILLARRQRAPVWMSEWALEFYGLQGWERRPGAERWQQLYLVCHPTRVPATVARNVAEEWRRSLGLSPAASPSQERGSPLSPN